MAGSEVCPTTGQPCEVREVCVGNRQAYTGMLESVARLEDTPLGRIFGFMGRFKDLSDAPHYVEKRQAEDGIRATDEVLARDCPGEEHCIVQAAYNQEELQVFPLAK